MKERINALLILVEELNGCPGRYWLLLLMSLKGKGGEMFVHWLWVRLEPLEDAPLIIIFI